MSTRKYYTIKLIAVLTMFSAHFSFTFKDYLNEADRLALFYIGRLAFPLFAFELVESFFFTRSKAKHLKSIIVLGLVSQIPYNLYMTGRPFRFEHINICATLALGFGMLMICEQKVSAHASLQWLYRGSVIAVSAVLAQFLRLDYGAAGIVLIGMLYIAKKIRKARMPLTASAFAVFAVLKSQPVIIADYALAHWALRSKFKESQKPARKSTRLLLKWFYPVHFILLYAGSQIIERLA